MCCSKFVNGKEYLAITPGVISIDAANSVVFKEKLRNIIAGKNYNILIDLINVKYIDSFGLASLISILKDIREKGDILLTNLNNTVTTYFNLTRMDRVFTIIDKAE